MAVTHHDQFIENLEELRDQYSEYSKILQLLIDQMLQGKAAQIELKLQQMEDEHW